MTVWADTFVGRTVASGGWGTASDGESYTDYQGSTSNLSVSGGEGIVTCLASNVQIMRLGTTTGTDIEAIARFSMQHVGTGPSTCDAAALFLRITGASNYYRLDIGSIDKSTIRLAKKNTSFVEIVHATSPYTIIASTFFWLKFRVQGISLYGRIWADGSPEPGNWHIVGSDSGLSSGGVGIGLNANTGSSSVQNVDTFSAQTIAAIPTHFIFGNARPFARIVQ